MSNIYHTEPPTQGKVVVKTSYGDIDIELWPKEAPLACRNFIQLCMEGYYDNSIVHRIIKDFMIQMGDPTGTGQGGESIWGRPFKDEFHGRVKFNHRGQVAMANDNEPHTNRSQFFITLAPCDWLYKKHTIFGKVTGNTIFNLLRLSEADTDDKDRPSETIRFIRAEVIWNPFDDIVPRDLSTLTSKQPPSAIALQPSKEKSIKNKKLLSFSDDIDEDEHVSDATGKVKVVNDASKKATTSIKKMHVEDNAHDIKKDQAMSRSSVKDKTHDNIGASTNPVHSDDFESKMKEKMLEKRRLLEKRSDTHVHDIKRNDSTPSYHNQGDGDMLDEDEMSHAVSQSTSSQNQTILDEKKREFDRLRADLMKSKRAVRVMTGSEAEADAKQEVVSALEQRRQKFLKRKRVHGDRQNETLSKLDAFTSKLRQTKVAVQSMPIEVEPVAEAYHGQVLEKDEDEDVDDEVKDGWHVGKLKFRRHIDDKYRMGGDGNMLDDYVVIDTSIDN